ncbi:unnamed protein product [Pseudo-nitzschia multistriata]|uniref:WW domain-containing protein n=1 Tax=Pseudo-nitzschia multistriata TaxID=183589 RepID=A0A448ZAA2_9STRA|nr:unnamed protein product [Pseudo-nitzschia multistriata]
MTSPWKSALDPRTGRTYYFHETTRETQWRKPICLANDDEMLAIKEKEQKVKDFFGVMEANILSTLSRGLIPGNHTNDQQSSSPIKEGESEGVPGDEHIEDQRNLWKARLNNVNPELVRTISTMDEGILTSVIRRQPSVRNIKLGAFNSELSLDLDDLRLSGHGPSSSPVGDGFDTWCNRGGSRQFEFQTDSLETLEEKAGEANSTNAPRATSELLSYLREPPTDDSTKETQALTKLVSLNKEMINAGKEHIEKTKELISTGKEKLEIITPISSTKKMIHTGKEQLNEFKSVAMGENTKCNGQNQVRNSKSPTRTLRRATCGDIGRMLPRELNFDDSDTEEEKPATPRNEKVARMVKNSSRSAADILHPTVQRRNTCGTMYIKTTMSAPDIDATIKCVCGVYRSHILSSEQENLCVEGMDAFKVFNDYPDNVLETKTYIPSLDEVTTFYRGSKQLAFADI